MYLRLSFSFAFVDFYSLHLSFNIFAFWLMTFCELWMITVNGWMDDVSQMLWIIILGQPVNIEQWMGAYMNDLKWFLALVRQIGTRCKEKGPLYPILKALSFCWLFGIQIYHGKLSETLNNNWFWTFSNKRGRWRERETERERRWWKKAIQKIERPFSNV